MDTRREWLEADGLGGFASGTAAGIRTRRYHALLLTATTPPTGRLVLVNGFEAWVDTPAGTFPLSSQAYAPEVVHPDGWRRIASFDYHPWPRWEFRLEDGTSLVQELFVPQGSPMVAVSWHLVEPREGVTLSVRPLLSGRDYHALHHENPAFRFEAEGSEGRLTWRPYDGVPPVVSFSNGAYRHQPEWYRNFVYEEERVRGLDFLEDLASPGILHWDLSRNQAVWLLGADVGEPALESLAPGLPADVLLKNLQSVEAARRRTFPSSLHQAADAYLVRRREGKTIIAGYPWFADWGRDTFIALRGLCLAAGRLDDARDILLEWAGTVSEGMLPNRFPDQGDRPEFNSVDASLWYVIAVGDYLEARQAANQAVPTQEQAAFREAIEAILSGYAQGTRFRIHLEEDGLLAAGEPGVQLTWMDAKVGNWVVTPRIGKPVEVQALWLNALKVGSHHAKRWQTLFERGQETFLQKFWNEESRCLFDVVDADHEPGKIDRSLRPNQIFAVGGLPVPLLHGDRAAAVVNLVESRLWTPLGLRSLASEEPGFRPRYEGGVWERDGAYHQGTVWPWLVGPFLEAWVRVRGGTHSAKQEARAKYLAPLLRHLEEAGLGHVSEITDADPPHTPRGSPFQAWSLGEVLRLQYSVLADARPSGRPKAGRKKRG